MMFEQENGSWSVGLLAYPYGRGITFELTVSDIESLYTECSTPGCVRIVIRGI